MNKKHNFLNCLKKPENCKKCKSTTTANIIGEYFRKDKKLTFKKIKDINKIIKETEND